MYYYLLLYRHECFTGKYTTRKIHKNYIWDLNLTREFINDIILVISLYYFIDFFLSIKYFSSGKNNILLSRCARS